MCFRSSTTCLIPKLFRFDDHVLIFYHFFSTRIQPEEDEIHFSAIAVIKVCSNLQSPEDSGTIFKREKPFLIIEVVCPPVDQTWTYIPYLYKVIILDIFKRKMEHLVKDYLQWDLLDKGLFTQDRKYMKWTLGFLCKFDRASWYIHQTET